MTALRFVAIVCLAVLPASPALAQYNGVPASGMMTKGDQPAGVQPADLQKIAFDQKLNAKLPLDLPLRDETGRAVMLGDFFNQQKPVVLTLVYFDCPMLCTQVVNGVAGAMKAMALEPGRDYELVTVSFNPRDTPQAAAKKKALAIQWYGHPEGASAWHFLTGQETAIKVLTEAVGFHYVYDQVTGQYAHATGLMVATPDGRVAKYLYGIEYAPRDLRLAVVDASGGRIGTPVDKLLLYCYHYDPAAGKYGLVVLNVIRLGGVVTVVVLGSFILVMTSRERLRNRQRPPAPPSTPDSASRAAN